jgi:hypothetical protein
MNTEGRSSAAHALYYSKYLYLSIFATSVMNKEYPVEKNYFQKSMAPQKMIIPKRVKSFFEVPGLYLQYEKETNTEYRKPDKGQVYSKLCMMFFNFIQRYFFDGDISLRLGLRFVPCHLLQLNLLCSWFNKGIFR